MRDEAADTVTISRNEYERLLAIAAGDGPADSIETFCAGERISKAFYQKMKNEGWAPKEAYYGTLPRILPQAKREWRAARMADGLRRGLCMDSARIVSTPNLSGK
jgi:hypothetical protein